MSQSLKRVRAELAERHGMTWARERLSWLMQKYDIGLSDEAPEELVKEARR